MIFVWLEYVRFRTSRIPVGGARNLTKYSFDHNQPLKFPLYLTRAHANSLQGRRQLDWSACGRFCIRSNDKPDEARGFALLRSWSPPFFMGPVLRQTHSPIGKTCLGTDTHEEPGPLIRTHEPGAAGLRRCSLIGGPDIWNSVSSSFSGSAIFLGADVSNVRR